MRSLDGSHGPVQGVDSINNNTMKVALSHITEMNGSQEEVKVTSHPDITRYLVLINLDALKDAARNRVIGLNTYLDEAHIDLD